LLRMPIDLAIRAFRTPDTAAVLQINAEGLPGVAPLGRDDLDAFARRPSAVVVAESDSLIVGYLIVLPAGTRYDGEEYQWFSERFKRFVYIDQIAVRRGHRRLGIAAQLYAWTMRWAVSQSIGTLTCEVNVDPPNPASLTFHRALGFDALDTLMAGDGRTVALMACSLSGQLDARE
jgi:predicted GNAT superfamily acetyltransferase